MGLNLDFQTVSNLKTAGRYTDSKTKGLQLLIKPSGTKYWLLRYSISKKRQDLGIGPFPEILTKEAREIAQEIRVQINRGINPIKEKKASKESILAKSANKLTFRDFAYQCVETKRAEWTNAKHADQWAYTLEQFAFPVIGNKYLDEIDTEDVLKILTPIWTTKTETASRLRGRLEWVLAAATTRKLRDGMNPALWRGHLQTILPAPKKVTKVKHHAAMPYRTLPSFLIKLRERVTASSLALEFLILNACRTSEVTGAIKTEIDGNIWTIPASRMKAKKEHRVPLCDRSLELLAIADGMDNGSPYLFSNNGKKLSGMAMSMLLRRMNHEVTVHGFRSTFRDWVSEETSHPPEVAEMALAHTIKNKVEAAYRRKDLLERRRLLMAEWQEFCNSEPIQNIVALKAA